ncbi:MAG: permease-like cell division protein FtsX, partial [Patescibacteria group bacterium]
HLIVMFTTLGRVTIFALQDLYRNVWLSVVTITILVLTLFSMNVLIVLNAMAGTAVQLVEKKVDISVYFKSSVAEDDILSLRQTILNLPEVANVDYISRDEALVAFKAANQDNQTIIGAIDELGDNPLGGSLRIRSQRLDQYGAILQVVDRPEYASLIATKDYANRQAMIEKISHWTASGRRVLIGFVMIFGLISALIVFNTIRVAIYTHREEIMIEKLVGATNWFVSLPFVIEGAIYAVISCLITAVVMYPVLAAAQPMVSNFFGNGALNLVHYFTSHLVLIFGSQFVVVLLLNIAASFVATRRYLKV